MGKRVLSICIPAFRRLEYVRKTLLSIYTEAETCGIDLDSFEVVLSDNDPIKGLEILKREFKYNNFYYFNSSCEGFSNSFYALSYGRGKFLKLHNSQEVFNNGALKKIICLINDNVEEKPLLFFTGGLLKTAEVLEVSSFDRFIRETNYLSSWSNAFGVWRDDFDLVKDHLRLNDFFPHTSILFSQSYKRSFIIDDRLLSKTQFVNKRGGHNKFQAFTIEYPSILESAVDSGIIENETRNMVVRKLMTEYLPLLFFNVKVAKRETFSSDGFEQNLKRYFPKYAYGMILFLSCIIPFAIIWRKMKMIFFLKCK